MRRNYLWYQFFRYGIVRPALRLFHSDVTVEGSEKIPAQKPVIFIGNHQNALMDALHVVSNTRRFIHFLTRAEPFQMPVLKHFFRSLNMLPVYRVRDGFSTIRKNAETFEQCYHRLQNGDAVLVFAEANHDLRRRVRPLSKGFTRIAFGAEQQNNWSLDIQVQPVGLNYGRHQKSQTPVGVIFGDCIPVSKFKQLYQKDKRSAARALTDEAATGLKQVTMHVPNLEHYPAYHLLLDDLEKNRRKLINPGEINERVSTVKEYLDEELVTQSKGLKKQAGKHDVNLGDFASSVSFTTGDLLMSPFYLFALVNNAVPYQLIRWTTGDYIEDHVFDATGKFLLGLFMLPIYYLVVSTVLGISGVSLLWSACYFFGSIITAPLFVRAKNLLFNNSAQKIKQEKPELYQELRTELDKFEALRDKLFGGH